MDNVDRKWTRKEKEGNKSKTFFSGSVKEEVHFKVFLIKLRDEITQRMLRAFVDTTVSLLSLLVCN